MILDTKEPRVQRALEILVDSMDWIQLIGADGYKAYAIRSQNPKLRTQHYITTRRSCSCEDSRITGKPCKHMMAVELYSIMVLGR